VTLAANTTAPARLAPERIHLRPPRITDGKSVHALIAGSPPLDTNSLYLNLLQCTHFAETCVIAEQTGSTAAPLGFISGYLVPERPRTLFIWQVAVAQQARGLGLAKAMLLELIARPACAAIDHVETTITESNSASWRLFRSLARTLECPFERQSCFDRDEHLDGVHESEVLVTIGPFVRRSASAKLPAEK
jgi:L-2,4-diaminobutyric acid acetyltransferase